MNTRRYSPARGLSRRVFVRRGAAALAAPIVLPSRVLGRGGYIAPNDRIQLGFVGMGGQGTGRNLRIMLGYEDARTLMVCDVDDHRCRNAARIVDNQYRSGACATTRDFRDVLARADIDAVVISTPDHWHVLMSVMAMRAGKDVLCEKPTLTIAEGRALAQTVARTARVYQTAVEDRSLGVYIRMAELVRAGRIGDVHTVRVQLPDGTGAEKIPLDAHRPRKAPDSLDFDLWLGPAPETFYCPARCHYNFRWVSDYSGGQLTDWGAHQINIAQWVLGADDTGPVDISGHGTFHAIGVYDTAKTYHLEYRYADGRRLIVDSGGSGMRFEGTRGWVGNSGFNQRVEASDPAVLDSIVRPHEARLYTDRRGEHRNFLDCVRSRRSPFDPAEAQHRYGTIAHLGNIAMRLGRPLRWDPVNESCVNDDQANRFRSRSMRRPWRL